VANHARAAAGALSSQREYAAITAASRAAGATSVCAQAIVPAGSRWASWGATDAAAYDVVVTTACGTVTSEPASLVLCFADINCDDFLDFFDYSDFVVAFENGDASADFNGDDFLDFFDYADFVQAFEAGC
jgi:hypothetical protein